MGERKGKKISLLIVVLKLLTDRLLSIVSKE